MGGICHQGPLPLLQEGIKPQGSPRTLFLIKIEAGTLHNEQTELLEGAFLPTDLVGIQSTCKGSQPLRYLLRLLWRCDIVNDAQGWPVDG